MRGARTSERGLTLLEVVIALMLFAMMALFLLSGHADAADAVLRAQVERETAELLRLRIDLISLEYEDYRDKTTEGEFPAGVSTRILDEEEVLGTKFEGYRWEATITETIGAGAAGRTEIEGGDSYNLLFDEEGGGSEDEEDGATTPAEEVDRMILIEVTVYPPGYDEQSDDEGALKPRSAWTAIHLPAEETEEAER